MAARDHCARRSPPQGISIHRYVDRTLLTQKEVRCVLDLALQVGLGILPERCQGLRHSRGSNSNRTSTNFSDGVVDCN